MTPTLARAVVLCDANVLYASLLRDLIVRLGVAGVLHPRWTAQIHDEWTRNLLSQRPDLDPQSLLRTRQLMDDAVPESLLTGPIDLQPVGLPDPDDEHVLAAARMAGASVLLTFNLSDFPATLVGPGLSVLHPDVLFTLLLVELEADVLAALVKLRRNLSRPALSALDLTHAFERLRLFTFAQQLQAHLARF